MMKCLILAGPTAIGKTDLSIAVAKALDAEIISGDSVQVYRGLNIGSAKITVEEMQHVPHHLIDHIDPNQAYTAADFQKEARAAVHDISKRDRLPFLVGGTGLYINGFLYDYHFADLPKDPDYRNYLEQKIANGQRELLYQSLRKKDPQATLKIKPRDDKRIIRALEVIHITGQPFSRCQNMLNAYHHPFYQMHYFALTMDRARLYERINQRVDIMLHTGLIEEVEALLKQGVSPDAQAFKAIGYKEVVSFLQGKTDRQTMVEQLKQNTRHFAKRQFTWFRRDPNIKWIDLDNTSKEEAADIIIHAARSM